MSVSFHSEQINYTISNASSVSEWLNEVCTKEGKSILEVSYIFCSDAYLLEMNRQFLDHDYFTDVITFDYCDGNDVSGDVFISVDRVSENALSLGASTIDEMHRVIVHGLLHLIGYNDKSKSEKSLMTEKEDYYLSLRTF